MMGWRKVRRRGRKEMEMRKENKKTRRGRGKKQRTRGIDWRKKWSVGGIKCRRNLRRKEEGRRDKMNVGGKEIEKKRKGERKKYE